MAKTKRTFDEGYALAIEMWDKSTKDAESLEDIERRLYVYPTAFLYHNPKKPNRIDACGHEDPLNDCKTILTRFDQGYLKALDDLRRKLNADKDKSQTDAVSDV